MKAYVYTNNYTEIFIAALFIIAKLEIMHQVTGYRSRWVDKQTVSHRTWNTIPSQWLSTGEIWIQSIPKRHRRSPMGDCLRTPLAGQSFLGIALYSLRISFYPLFQHSTFLLQVSELHCSLCRLSTPWVLSPTSFTLFPLNLLHG